MVRGCFDPAGADGVDAHPPGEADGQRVRQCSDTALGGRIAFGVRLGHCGARGRNVDDGRARRKRIFQQQRKHVRRGDAHAQHVVKIVIAAAREDAPAGDARVVDEIIDLPEARAHGVRKAPQIRLLGDVSVG